MFAVAGIERIGGVAEPPLQLLDHLQHRLAGARAEDTLVDQQPGHRARAGRRQADHGMVLLVEFGEGHTRLVLRLADEIRERRGVPEPCRAVRPSPASPSRRSAASGPRSPCSWRPSRFPAACACHRRSACRVSSCVRVPWFTLLPVWGFRSTRAAARRSRRHRLPKSSWVGSCARRASFRSSRHSTTCAGVISRPSVADHRAGDGRHVAGWRRRTGCCARR